MDNPYQAPEDDSIMADEPRGFQDLSFKELKKLRNHSSTINAMGGLWVIGGVLQVVGGLFFVSSSGYDSAPFGFIYVLLGVFALLCAFGAFTRPSWGRPLGILLCCLAMLGFPLGTLIGILGLIGFASGASLFGPDRILHKNLNDEFKYRKKNKIFA